MEYNILCRNVGMTRQSTNLSILARVEGGVKFGCVTILNLQLTCGGQSTSVQWGRFEIFTNLESYHIARGISIPILTVMVLPVRQHLCHTFMGRYCPTDHHPREHEEADVQIVIIYRFPNLENILVKASCPRGSSLHFPNPMRRRGTI